VKLVIDMMVQLEDELSMPLCVKNTNVKQKAVGKVG